jgi:membrane-associated phospholipid phosphatase
VAINAQYPSDVLAGLLGGLGVLATFAILSRRFDPESGRAGSEGERSGDRRDALVDPAHPD